MKTITVNGVAVVTTNQNNKAVFVQFLPDDEFTPVLEVGSTSCGQLQLLRNGTFDYVASKPRIRNNELLIRKVRHGRLSGTRDRAFQLTLKVFAAEQIDWMKAILEESVEVMADLMGPERVSRIVTESLKKLEAQGQVEKSWKPFDVEW